MTHEAVHELISAWYAYDLATRPDATYCVVPPRGLSDPKRAKAPVGLGPKHEWKQWQQERPSDALLWQWYVQEQRKGVGIVLGAVSGGLHCLDWEGRAVDSGFYADCVAALRAAGLGPEWDHISAYGESTPSGGVHHFYRLATPRPKTVLVRAKTGETYLEDLGQGEYVLVAPSHQVSEQGMYSPVPVWPADLGATELTSDMDVARAVALEQLFEGHLFLEGPTVELELIDAIHATIQGVAKQWKWRTLETPIPVWERERALVAHRGATPLVRGTRGDDSPHVGELLKCAPGITDTVVGWLEQVGWQRTRSATIHGDGVAVTRPGKSAEHISGVVGGNGKPGMFHCWTSSSSDFQAGDTYTPLQVYSIVAFGSTSKAAMGAATRDLERRLGITRPRWDALPGGARA